MARVTLTDVSKDYTTSKGEKVRAVDQFNLDIHAREFMVLIGPSGCGKSTTLRMIAGLEKPDEGEIEIAGKSMRGVEPKDRDIAMVFQNFGLYPHMSVYDNMAFGLKMRRHSREEVHKRVYNAAKILEITDILERRPSHLSGGEQQRVAVGRAIVRNPKIFLFDEPLSNLDAKMRVGMRTEISKLHARLACTMIYVTHDQTEAMTMGDRICVMREGKIEQVDEPMKLYNNPCNMFVAGFIGSPPMNFLRGTLQRKDALLEFREVNEVNEPIAFTLDDTLSRKAAAYVNRDVVFGIRPEDVANALSVTSPDPAHVVESRVELSEPMGPETYLYLHTGQHSFIARVHSTDRYEINQKVKLHLLMERAHVFDPHSGNVLA